MVNPSNRDFWIRCLYNTFGNEADLKPRIGMARPAAAQFVLISETDAQLQVDS
jgi:hypothetical protein